MSGGVKRMIATVALAAAATMLCAGSAAAASPSPSWSLDSFATATNFWSGQNGPCLSQLTGENPPCDAYTVRATNVGSKATNGSSITLTDTVPPGLTVRRVAFFWRGDGAKAAGKGANTDLAPGSCTTAPVKCELATAVAPDDLLVMAVYVTVDEPAAPGPLLNSATVSGGGVPTVTTTEHNAISAALAPFGVHLFRGFLAGIDGQPDTRAGGHPYELSTRIGLDSVFRQPPNVAERPEADSSEDVRDVVVDLPLGFIGSAIATPTCTQADVLALGGTGCAKATIVGHLQTEPTGLLQTDSPIYNMVPERGRAAEFAYTDVLGGMHVIYAGLAPTPSGYVLRATSQEVPQIILTDISATFFGNPGLKNGAGKQIAMFTNPTTCNGEPLTTTVHIDSWQSPGTYNPDGTPNLADPNWVSTTSDSPPVTGCNQLQFTPTIAVKPTTTQGDSPSGLDVTIEVPQPTDPATLATPPLKKAVVALPSGMTVNPSSANGLIACSLAELGMSASGVPDAAPPHCPDASKVGTVAVETPAVAGTLEGQVYLAKQGDNPFGTLLALYIVFNDPTTGIVVKIPAEVKLDPATGQLTTIVDNSPQFPFSKLTTHFFGGTRAALRTPAVCGDYEVTSQLTPWSAPESGPPATPSASFKITEGCAESTAEEPSDLAFSAGTVAPTAGLYSPLVTRLKREDGSQELSSLSVTAPPGLSARIAGVAECPDAALAAAEAKSGSEELASPSCPSGSQIGHVTVGAGAGLTPYYTSGRVYLAGPYKGAPLSLAILTPALAGPFDLGTVVVRTALRVDPVTTVTTAASDEIPHALQGIPLDVRSIALELDRSNFTLNPTSCEQMAFSGFAGTVLGRNVPLANRFQVGGCNALKFKPKLSLRLKGGTRRGRFPALRAVLTYPKKGAYANVAKAQVTLPHAQFVEQAHIGTVCTQAQLSTRSCPPKSIYGRARAVTPLLDKPLEGPVYMGVGYGHTLPDLVAELDGQIRVLLNGKVDSGKENGVRNTFEAVPDAPVTKFTLELFGGKRGLIVNSENLCRRQAKVHALAHFVAQNGRVFNAKPKVRNSCKRHRKSGSHKRHKPPKHRRSLTLPGDW